MEPVETSASAGGAVGTKQKAAASKKPHDKGIFKRSLNWFWGAEPPQGDDAALSPARALEYERRARIAAEWARRALEPPEPFVDGQPDGLAAGLYHQSIVWGLRSLAERRSIKGLAANGHSAPSATVESAQAKTGDEATPAATPSDDDADATSTEITESAESAETKQPSTTSSDSVGEPVADLAKLGVDGLWQAAAPEKLLLEANLTQAEIDEAKQQLSGCSFADYTDLPSDDQVRWGRKLRIVAEGLLYGIEVTSGRYSPPWLGRALRVGSLLLLLGGIGWGAVAVREWMVELDNIARGKSWTISSVYPMGCRSPAQKCMESPSFFFHTQEQQGPWVEFDLGTPQRFSRVKVRNREDCCSDRAVPLVLEASSDGKKWNQLARKNEVFSTWQPEFTATEARWVRLRSTKKTMLHFVSVDIYK